MSTQDTVQCELYLHFGDDDHAEWFIKLWFGQILIEIPWLKLYLPLLQFITDYYISPCLKQRKILFKPQHNDICSQNCFVVNYLYAK